MTEQDATKTTYDGRECLSYMTREGWVYISFNLNMVVLPTNKSWFRVNPDNQYLLGM